MSLTLYSTVHVSKIKMSEWLLPYHICQFKGTQLKDTGWKFINIHEPLDTSRLKSILKSNFRANLTSTARIFLQNRIQWVSKYVFSRLPMWSERFLKNLGPTRGAPLIYNTYWAVFKKCKQLNFRPDCNVQKMVTFNFLMHFKELLTQAVVFWTVICNGCDNETVRLEVLMKFRTGSRFKIGYRWPWLFNYIATNYLFIT